MTYRKFEELPAWQTSRKLVRAVYAVSGKGRFRSDWNLRDQIRKAAVSMTANVAEGFSRRSDREFVQFLFAAKASAAEVQSHLYTALDLDYINHGDFQDLYGQAENFARQTSGLISFLTDQTKGKRIGKMG